MNYEERLAKLEEQFGLVEKKKKPYSSVTYTTGDPQLNIDHFNKMLMGKEENTHTSGYLNGTFRHDNKAAEQAAAKVGTFASQSPDGASSISTGAASSSSGDAGGSAGGVGESLVKDGNELEEAKRYVRRYYMRPQDIFCSNKDEVLKALIEHEDEDSVIYTLNNLGDNKDVHKLNDNDIIYYYEDGILYDKNHVRIMDYDLSIKHEEERAKINPNTVSDKTFADVYDDRMTELTQLEEEANLDEGVKKDFETLDDKKIFNKSYSDKLTKDTAGKTLNIETNGGTKFYTIVDYDIDNRSGDIYVHLINKSKEQRYENIDAFFKPAKDRNGNKFKLVTNDETVSISLEVWKEAYAAEAAKQNKVKNRANNLQNSISAGRAIGKQFINNQEVIDWLKEHVRDMQITLHYSESNSASEYFSEADIDTFNNRIDTYLNNFPDAIEGKDYILNDVDSESDNVAKWGITYHRGVGEISFDTAMENAPQSVKDLLQECKIKAAEIDPTHRTSPEVKWANDSITCTVLYYAIAEIFNDNIHFYTRRGKTSKKGNKNTVSADDAFNLDFESISVPDFSDLQEALDANFDTHSLDEFIGKHCVVTLGSKVLDGTIKSFTKDDENRVIITLDVKGKSFEVILETVVDLNNIKLDDETDTADLKNIIIAAKLPEEEVVVVDPKVAAKKEAENGKADGKATAIEQFGTERGKTNFNKYKDEYNTHQLDKRNLYQYYYKLTFLQTYQGLKNEAKAKKAAEKATKAKHEEFCLDFDSLAEDIDDNKCVICGEEIKGYGNNAEPYAHGRCCDACNLKFVLPARIEALRRGE